MTTTVQHRRSETTGSEPAAGDILVGELAVNLADGKLFSKKTDGTIVTLAGNLTATTYYIPTSLGYITETPDFGTDFGLITATVSNGNTQETNTTSDVTFDSVETNILTIGGKQAVNGPAFRAYPTTGQTITSGSLQKVNFGGETFDTGGCFANNKFTPNVAGYYQLNSTIRLDGSNGTGECMIVIYKNGAEHARGWNSSGVQFASNFWSMSVSDLAYANGTTDYFEIYIQHGSGSDRTVTPYTNISFFSGCMIRGA